MGNRPRLPTARVSSTNRNNGNAPLDAFSRELIRGRPMILGMKETHVDPDFLEYARRERMEQAGLPLDF